MFITSLANQVNDMTDKDCAKRSKISAKFAILSIYQKQTWGLHNWLVLTIEFIHFLFWFTDGFFDLFITGHYAGADGWAKFSIKEHVSDTKSYLYIMASFHIHSELERHNSVINFVSHQVWSVA